MPIIQEEVSEVTINVSLRGLPMLLKTMPEVRIKFFFREKFELEMKPIKRFKKFNFRAYEFICHDMPG